jgi:hypothetical protein
MGDAFLRIWMGMMFVMMAVRHVHLPLLVGGPFGGLWHPFLLILGLLRAPLLLWKSCLVTTGSNFLIDAAYQPVTQHGFKCVTIVTMLGHSSQLHDILCYIFARFMNTSIKMISWNNLRGCRFAMGLDQFHQLRKSGATRLLVTSYVHPRSTRNVAHFFPASVTSFAWSRCSM